MIRCPKGNAAEMVARKLESKIKEHTASARGSSHLFSGGEGSNAWSSNRPREHHRPVRSFDEYTADPTLNSVDPSRSKC